MLLEFESRKVVTSKGNDDPMGFGNGSASSQVNKNQNQDQHTVQIETQIFRGDTNEGQTTESSETSLTMSTLANNETYIKTKTLNYKKSAILKVSSIPNSPI